MDVYEAIYARRTVRDFKARKVEPEVLKKILNAGLQAPSNDHRRQWEFVIVDDLETRVKVIGKINQQRTTATATRIVDEWGLSDACQRAMYLDAIPKQYRMLLNAGSLIIPCFYQKDPLLEPQNLSALNPFASIWCCIENILLAAASEGMYGVTRIPFDQELAHIKDVLHIPPDYEFPCYLALGYPDEQAPKIEQSAINVVDHMHLNSW